MSMGFSPTMVKALGVETNRPVINCLMYLDISNTRRFVSAPLSGYPEIPASVVSVVPVARELDWKEHKASVNKVSMTLIRDPIVNQMISGFPVVGAVVELYIIFDGMNPSTETSAPYFIGYAEEPMISETHVVIPVVSIAQQLMQRRITGGWINKNPVEVIADILSKAQLDNWMAPDVFSYLENDFPHYCISRASVDDAPRAAGAISDPTTVDDAIRELLKLLRAYVIPQENGLLYLKWMPRVVYTPEANWTTNDFTDLTVVSLYENMMNEIGIQSHFQADQQLPENMIGGPQGKWNAGLIRRDTAAQTRFGMQYPGGGTVVPRVCMDWIQTAWINGHTRLASGITAGSPGVGGTFDVKYNNPGELAVSWGQGGEGQLEGMCGASWGSDWFAGGAQEVDRQLTDAHTAFVMINDEIIEVDRLTLSTRANSAGAHLTFYTDPSDATPDAAFPFPFSATYRVKARGAQNTTAAAHGSGNSVEDVTIQVNKANADLAQFANGGPVIKLRTSLRWYGVQIGDDVAVTDPSFLAYNRIGLDTTWRWYVIGKTVDLFGDKPGITWTLLYLTETTPPTATLGTARQAHRMDRGMSAMTVEQAGRTTAEFGERHVASGLATSATSGFGVSVATGIASTGTLRQRNPGAVALTCRASRDTYVYWNLSANAPVMIDVANGAAAPTAQPEWVLLAKAVTDGSSVTGVTDLRNYSALNGSKLVDLSLASTKYGANSVVAGKLADGAVDTSARIVDGVVVENKIGSLAVSSGKIAANAVIAGKLADGSVDTAARLAANVVTAAKILDGEVQAAHLKLEIPQRHNKNFGSFRSV